MSVIESNHHRIVVVGTSGSGKSTVAERISKILNISKIELDALHWEPDWTEAPLKTFTQRVKEALQSNSWVVDGNYGKVRSEIWVKAQVIVWLDYPFHVVFTRTLYRTIKRVITQEILWAGNRESVSRSFLSKHSILVWVIQTYSRRKREYPELFARPEYSQIKVVRLQSQNETEKYLQSLQN